MSERHQIGALLSSIEDLALEVDTDPLGISDQIIAEMRRLGWHKPRVITTAEELGELPDGSVVLGLDHSLWHREGCWLDQEGHPASSNPVIEEHGPVTVLHEVARDE